MIKLPRDGMPLLEAVTFLAHRKAMTLDEHAKLDSLQNAPGREQELAEREQLEAKALQSIFDAARSGVLSIEAYRIETKDDVSYYPPAGAGRQRIYPSFFTQEVRFGNSAPFPLYIAGKSPFAASWRDPVVICPQELLTDYRGWHVPISIALHAGGGFEGLEDREFAELLDDGVDVRLSDADALYWAQQSCWSLEEAALLFLGLDPRKAPPAEIDALKARIHGAHPVLIQYDALLDRLLRAHRVGGIQLHEDPPILIAWARADHIELSEHLSASIAKGDVSPEKSGSVNRGRPREDARFRREIGRVFDARDALLREGKLKRSMSTRRAAQVIKKHRSDISYKENYIERILNGTLKGMEPLTADGGTLCPFTPWKDEKKS